MWPFIVAFGAYMICKGIQDGIDQNRDQNQRRLPPRGNDDPMRYLSDDDIRLLIEDDRRKNRYGR